MIAKIDTTGFLPSQRGPGKRYDGKPLQSKHPYLRTEFWLTNQFWESPKYSEAAKEAIKKSVGLS